jgi:hypothetical protein
MMFDSDPVFEIEMVMDNVQAVRPTKRVKDAPGLDDLSTYVITPYFLALPIPSMSLATSRLSLFCFGVRSTLGMGRGAGVQWPLDISVNPRRPPTPRPRFLPAIPRYTRLGLAVTFGSL